MRKAIIRSWIKRTWKRETAGILLMFWLGWTTFILVFTSIERVAALTGIFGMITPAVFMFAMGAFGLDAYLKERQGTPNSTPEAR